MNNNDVFDTVGADGIDNQKAWDRLPLHLKYFIQSTQEMILAKVTNTVRRLYGEEGCKDLVKTSGFRSRVTNSRNGGVADSLHLFGCAIDFRKCGIFEKIPIPVCCNLEVIDEPNHWHIQLKRS